MTGRQGHALYDPGGPGNTSWRLLPMTNTSNPVALITGGARGIGNAITRRLASEGYAVAINFAHSADAAERLVEEIGSRRGDAIALQCDIGVADQRRRMLDAILQRWGRIDLLVNNAGITSIGRKDLLDATESSWDRVFDTNLKGPFFLTQAVCRAMVKLRSSQHIARGTIVNISSISSYAVSTNRADYCLTKSATEMMTHLFATRMAEHDVAVYEISPGVIRSDMTAPVQEKYDRLIADGLTPIRRWGEPDDVAQGVVALAGGCFPFCTGQRIDIDGGFHIRRL